MNNPGKSIRENTERQRILIVDDKKMVGDSIARVLALKGFNVYLALTGEDALRKIKKEVPSLIVLDFNLPDISGLEVLKRIRDKGSNVPVIFITGYGSETVAIEAFKLGIKDYFVKPFHPKELENSVLGVMNEAGSGASENSIQQGVTDTKVDSECNIKRAVKYIKDNYRSRITLDDISRIAGLSRSNFMYKFKNIMGVTFNNYLNHVRIVKAEKLLDRDNITVSEVAVKTGFNSLRNFERVFKKISGIPPKKFFRKSKGNISA